MLGGHSWFLAVATGTVPDGPDFQSLFRMVNYISLGISPQSSAQSVPEPQGLPAISLSLSEYAVATSLCTSSFTPCHTEGRFLRLCRNKESEESNTIESQTNRMFQKYLKEPWLFTDLKTNGLPLIARGTSKGEPSEKQDENMMKWGQHLRRLPANLFLLAKKSELSHYHMYQKLSHLKRQVCCPSGLTG